VVAGGIPRKETTMTQSLHAAACDFCGAPRHPDYSLAWIGSCKACGDRLDAGFIAGFALTEGTHFAAKADGTVEHWWGEAVLQAVIVWYDVCRAAMPWDRVPPVVLAAETQLVLSGCPYHRPTPFWEDGQEGD
jgi:hypothetical protein